MTYAAIVRAIWGDTDASSTKKLQVNMANIRKSWAAARAAILISSTSLASAIG